MEPGRTEALTTDILLGEGGENDHQGSKKREKMEVLSGLSPFLISKEGGGRGESSAHTQKQDIRKPLNT